MAKVLIVDDEPLNRNLAKLMLGRAGVESVVAEGGEACLDMLDTDHDIDRILLDISMPGISGIAVCRAIRDNPNCRGVRIVAYTAHAFEHQREELVKAGFDDILTKPFQSEDLFRALLLPLPAGPAD